MKVWTAIPVYNEERHLLSVLSQVQRYCADILVVNDGSTDQTAGLLRRLRRSGWPRTASGTEQPGTLRIITHAKNRGYGAALISAFEAALEAGVDVLVTMDCDGQHEPSRIPVLLEAIHDADIVSGSRYLRLFRHSTPAPDWATQRLQINRRITAELNERFGLHLTDAFCGFKAYRASALSRLRITETGWGMPLQVWVQAARLGLRIKEVGVPRVYLDPNRTFGGVLDNADERLAYYRQVIAEAEKAFPAPPPVPSATAGEGEAGAVPPCLGTPCPRGTCR
jgi:dolichol-phosphate mannosyltransferase